MQTLTWWPFFSQLKEAPISMWHRKRRRKGSQVGKNFEGIAVVVCFVEHHALPFCFSLYDLAYHATSRLLDCSFLHLSFSFHCQNVELLQDPFLQTVLSHILLHMCAGARLTSGAECLVSILCRTDNLSFNIRDQVFAKS